MSARIRRRFTENFKANAVAKATEQGQVVSRVAVDLDLADSVLKRWIDQSRRISSQASVGTGQSASRAAAPTPEQQEPQQLRRLLRMARASKPAKPPHPA